MEPAVRYDFSFPPKSSSLNSNNMSQNGPCGISSYHGYSHSIYNGSNNQRHHNHHSQDNHNQNQNYYTHHNVANHASNVGLSKSASTSLLSCVPQSHNINNSYSKMNNNNFCNTCNSKDCTGSSHSCLYKKTSNSNSNSQQYRSNRNSSSQSNYTAMPNTQQQQSSLSSNLTTIGAPATPKDGNCSFTFDDLKNTLAFMEDSPLINPNSSNGNTNNPNTSALMVIPNIQSADCASSLSSSSSSSSALSSSSCNSCCAPGFLPKSNSNPMLVSSGSSAGSVSPNSVNQQQSVKNECGAHHHHHHTQHHYTQTNSVLDLLIKKSPSDQEQSNYSPTSALNSLIAPASSLLASVHQNPIQMGGINTAIETAAKKYRSAAQISEATCCWKGKLPAKQYKTPIVYSTKVFVGGLPWDISEEDLVKEFGVFGPCRVEWTNKEKYNLLSSNHAQQVEDQAQNGGANHQSYRHRSMPNKYNSNNTNSNESNNSAKQRSSPGFAYVIYESEYSVRSLVGNCIEDYQHGRDRVEYYFKISTRRVRNKEVQIIPWILADNNFALCTPKELDPKKTVFVGNLHGTMTARDLAHIMNELFGCVVYAGIDIDKLKYPIGSGRVTFSHQQNFMRAVRAAFVDIQSSKFSKRIQIDPYLEDVQCCLCYNDKGIYFCRDFQCFNYYCGGCWDKQHSYNQLGNHKPLMRKREDKV